MRTVRKNLSGQRFGRLSVIEATKNKRGRSAWLCLCDCGNSSIVKCNDLISGNTRSCGCYGLEVKSTANTTHGMTDSPEHQSWRAMKDRCQHTTHKSYKDYGGKGIVVCREWEESFDAFYKHIGPRPSPLHTLDRKDSRGNYEPGNVRWATRREQVMNRTSRCYTWIVMGLRFDTLQEAAAHFGVGPGTIRNWVVGLVRPITGTIRPPMEGCSREPLYE